MSATKTMKIKIANTDWTVDFYDSETSRKYSDAAYKSAYGMTDFQRNTIMIRTDMTASLAKNTITHELTHATMFVYNIFSRRNKIDEETVCEFMEYSAESIVDLTTQVFAKWQTSLTD